MSAGAGGAGPPACAGAKARPNAPPGLDHNGFDYLRRLVQEHSAIVLEPGKEYLVESRLGPVARAIGVDSVRALVASLKGDRDGALTRAVVEAMTTNETSFFRDRHPFEALRARVLPELLDGAGRGRRLEFWSAACSSGQEVYSILMVLAEHFPELLEGRVGLLGTDLSSEMVQRCGHAVYSHLEVNRGLPVHLLPKYFIHESGCWRIVDRLRRLPEFKVMNLARPWPALPAMDCIFLRNVLIYFDEATKHDILGRTCEVLRPGGYLFMGASETALSLDARFEQVRAAGTMCYRRRAD